jgi:hypothetical protein
MMLDLILSAGGGAIIGAAFTFVYCHTHATGDAAAVARLRRELLEHDQRAKEREAELWRLLAEYHLQAIVVERRIERN